MDDFYLHAHVMVNDPSGLAVIPAYQKRNWMNATSHGFANRCLPMLMANQLGWNIISTHAYDMYSKPDGSFDFFWTDAQGRPDMCPTSHFGGHVVTWNNSWLFRTPPGWDLLIIPPANEILPLGVTVLAGLVETDHSIETFTLNWRVEPRTKVSVGRGDTIATIVPYPTDVLENFSFEVRTDLPPEHAEWARARADFNATNKDPKRWQKDYWNAAKRRKLKFTKGTS